MFATRAFQLLILAVAVLCVAQGSWWDEHRIPSRAMIRRQAEDGPSTPSAGPTSRPSNDDDNQGTETSSVSVPNSQETSSVAAPNQETSSAVVPPASETNKAPETSSEKPQSTASQAPASTSSTEADSQITSSANLASSETSAAPVSSTSAPQKDEDKDKDQDKDKTQDDESSKTITSASVSTSISVVTKTHEDGSKETSTKTTLTTFAPELNSDDESSSSGMTEQTKKTIIGVVVGIGGAIVLGALGLVAWRIWGRKKQAEENDGLMAYDNGYSGAEKSESGHSPTPSTSQRSPFQSTLENYHQPAHVNASSNF